jgi:hypothetical protein
MRLQIADLGRRGMTLIRPCVRSVDEAPARLLR